MLSNFITYSQIGPDLLPEQVGMSDSRYRFLLEHFFGRVPHVYTEEEVSNLVPERGDLAGTEYYDPDEWRTFTILAYSRCGIDLLGRPISSLDIGLRSWCMNTMSTLPNDLADIDKQDVVILFRAMEFLWTELIAKIVKDEDFDPRGSGGSSIAVVVFMWFEGWVAPRALHSSECDPSVKSAFWQVFRAMLSTRSRVVEAAAWHGINHYLKVLDRKLVIQELHRFSLMYESGDTIVEYAKVASKGMAL